MDMKYLFILLALFSVIITGCTALANNYYEVEEGLFCIDNDKNEECDKDEVDLDPENLYEFEDGKFCIDADDNKVCDDDETKEQVTANVINNSSGLKEGDSADEANSSTGEKTEHELCLEKYDMEPGTIIFRYASWNPFFDDTYVKSLEEAGFTVYRDKIGTDVKETYDASDLMKECFEGVYAKKDFLPPRYLCSSNKDVLGDPNIAYADLRTFADDCNRVDVV